MAGFLPFAQEPREAWQSLVCQIHDVVWKDVGLSTVQDSVRKWAEQHACALDAAEDGFRVRNATAIHWADSLEICDRDALALFPDVLRVTDPEYPLPPDDHSPSPTEKWAGLAAIHDVYWKGAKINPWPQPAEEDTLELWATWVSMVWDYARLMERAGSLPDTDAPFVAAWLKEVAPGEAQAVTTSKQPSGAKRRKRSKGTPRKPRPLTAKQVETVQVVSECKGNIAQAAERLRKDANTVREAYKTAMEKLGKDVYKSKDKTRLLARDRRGQEDIADIDDQRRDDADEDQGRRYGSGSYRRAGRSV